MRHDQLNSIALSNTAAIIRLYSPLMFINLYCRVCVMVAFFNIDSSNLVNLSLGLGHSMARDDTSVYKSLQYAEVIDKA